MKQKIAIYLFILVIVVLGNSALFNNAFGQQGNNTLESCPAGQTADSSGKCQLTNPAPGQLVNYSSFEALLIQIVRIMLLFAGAIAVIFIIIGGFQYVAARGNEEATEKAKKTITNAVIGLVIILLAYAIVTIVNNLLVNAPTPAGQGGESGVNI